jgi:hypothetical protein
MLALILQKGSPEAEEKRLGAGVQSFGVVERAVGLCETAIYTERIAEVSDCESLDLTRLGCSLLYGELCEGEHLRSVVLANGIGPFREFYCGRTPSAVADEQSQLARCSPPFRHRVFASGYRESWAR